MAGKRGLTWLDQHGRNAGGSDEQVGRQTEYMGNDGLDLGQRGLCLGTQDDVAGPGD